MSRPTAPKYEISDEVLADIEEHCFSEVSHELGGFLVGEITESVTKITGAIRSTKAVSQQTSLTFTHEAWDEAYQALATDHPESQIIGWYHSHPGFGVFMSDYDAFIQENFFKAQGQLALVVDPLAGKLGWFWWKKDAIAKITEKDTSREGLGGSATDYIPVVTSASKPAGSSLNVEPSTVIVAVVACLLAGVLGFFVGQKQGGSSGDLQALSASFNTLVGEYETLDRAYSLPALSGPEQGGQAVYLRYLSNELDQQIFNNGGDWLGLAALRFGSTAEAIKAANPGVDFATTLPVSIAIPIKAFTTAPAPEVAAATPTVTPTPTPSTTTPTPSSSPSLTLPSITPTGKTP